VLSSPHAARPQLGRCWRCHRRAASIRLRICGCASDEVSEISATSEGTPQETSFSRSVTLETRNREVLLFPTRRARNSLFGGCPTNHSLGAFLRFLRVMPGSFRRSAAFNLFRDVLADLPRSGLAFPYKFLSFAFRRPQQTTVRHGIRYCTRFGGDHAQCASNRFRHIGQKRLLFRLILA
jgi:hypothetical protein